MYHRSIAYHKTNVDHYESNIDILTGFTLIAFSEYRNLLMTGRNGSIQLL